MSGGREYARLDDLEGMGDKQESFLGGGVAVGVLQNFDQLLVRGQEVVKGFEVLRGRVWRVLDFGVDTLNQLP